ncbi:MAG: hypothetical protein QOF89_1270 [Acidobacteriota bacterium]|jgi:uncharacterized membrane protein (UPF0136 family)|nr:hypothetical protein [Acidobacteriota bacterium]
MAPLYQFFFDYGGPWIVILGVLSWIAFSQLSQTQDEAQRWVKALSTEWLMRSAVVIALLSWGWSFGRLFLGAAYLRGAGKLEELSTALLGLILILAGVAWRAISRPRFQRFQPWITQGLSMALIVSAGALLAEAPEGDLSQSTSDKQRPAITFVQGRLARLGCFEAVGVPEPKKGKFDALTTLAIISFQSANNLLTDPRVSSKPGEIAAAEFELLARPFPFLFGPERCPPPKKFSRRPPQGTS